MSMKDMNNTTPAYYSLHAVLNPYCELVVGEECPGTRLNIY